MRLKRLDLKAFGPFTDRTLVFDSREPGLHIIYGANEAGKSTSLRALKALLYGFPERTPDNFQHANDQLLVGGCLQGADGRELSFLRRKKRKADLLDLDGNPMDPGVLAALLHGIEPAVFESLYGIDHHTLVAGGEDILAQKGEVGQILFAAGAGIPSLKKILDALDAEAEELFKARGSKQLINQALSEYKALKKVVREASLLPGKWKEHQQRLNDAEAVQAGLEEESRWKNAEVRRLDRLARAIPELALLEQYQKQLQELGAVVVLPPEFPEQLREVEQFLRDTRLQISKDKDRLTNLQAKRNEISVNRPLLDHAAAIEDLHQRLGEYRKGQADRSRLEGMRIACRKDAGTLRKGIRPDLRLEDIEIVRPALSQKRTIQDLSSRHEALSQQAVQASALRAEADRELKEIDTALSGLPVLRQSDQLAKLLQLARRAGDIDDLIATANRALAAEQQSCLAEQKRLGLWAGALDQLPELMLPFPETIHRFETTVTELDQERRQLQKDRLRVEAELKAARTECREMAYGGEIPTEQDLQASRQKRHQGWRLLRRQWVDGENVSQEAMAYDPDRPLHEAYEKLADHADHVADRLWREAERVARMASLRARIEGLEDALQEISRQESELARNEAELATQWQAEWMGVGIAPRSPKEMRAWLSDIDKLRSRVTKTLQNDAEVKEKDRVRQQRRMSLADELQTLGTNVLPPGQELGPFIVAAESILEEITRQRAELDKLRDRQAQVRAIVSKAQKDEATARSARADWQERWNKALAGLELRDQLQPSEALDLLETVTQCFEKLEKAKELQSRIDGIDRDADTFRSDIRILLAQTVPDLTDLPPDQAVLHLYTQLGKTRQESEALKKNVADAEALLLEIKNGTKTLHSLEERMAALLATAGCNTAAELAEAIRKSAEFQRLEEKIATVRSSLARICEGIPLDEIRDQAAAEDVNALPGQIVSLRRQVDEELYPKITANLKRIGEENKELQLMDGSARAAEAAGELAQVAARLHRLVDQYIRFRLAAGILRNEIERYREEHQDPVLQIASRFFAELTLGSFIGLRTDMDDNGNPILVGIRPDASRLMVAGMSSGTRDQLYLALRLATLEWRLQTCEPLPFIVDDILINFDDERSRATLAALAELAEKNQVILFTHHRQIIHAAAQLKEKPIFVYEL